jgi:8-oxo-dGTP diphosphatase
VSDVPRIAVGAVVLDRRADGVFVVLARRNNPPRVGQWSLPGGKVERGESLTAALAREILEECGLVVSVGPLVEVVEFIDERVHYVILDYLCALRSGALRAGDDASEVCWAPVRELASYQVTDAVARVVDKALKG